MKLKVFFNYLILFFSIQLFMFTEWLHRYFGKVDFEQILVFLNFGTRGLLNTEDYVIEKFIQLCIYFPILILIIIYICIFLFKKIKTERKILKLLINNNFKTILVIFFFSFIYFFQVLDISKQFLNSEKSDFIKKNYTHPKLKKIKKSNKKDLLLIYLESFSEEFSKNTKLSNQTLNYINFKNLNNFKVKNFYQTTYNNYTIGAIVSSQCGIPQKPIGMLDTRFDNRKTKNVRDIFGLKNFLPNAICLGDVLKYNNYKNVFINSINPNFQAMNIFFNDHGYEEIIGKNYFVKKGYQNFNSWGEGANDRILFLEAEKLINKFKKNNESFNINILTTDTHYPGYRDSDCEIAQNQKLSDLNFSISCTSKHLFNFISKIKKKYGESIIILIIGDHLNPIPQIKKENYDKEPIYNRIVNSNIKIYRDEMNHYDVFPTLLDLIEFPFENKVGLGFSVLRKYPGLDYKKYKMDLKNNIEKRSEFYYEFWK